mgnify:CR=1 FL=1
MNTKQTFGSITIEMNENKNFMATGYYGFTAIIRKGMTKQQVEQLMASQGLAGDMGYLGALDYLQNWAAA